MNRASELRPIVKVTGRARGRLLAQRHRWLESPWQGQVFSLFVPNSATLGGLCSLWASVSSSAEGVIVRARLGLRRRLVRPECALTTAWSVVSRYYAELVCHRGAAHTASVLPAVARQEPHPIVPEPPWQWLSTE